jgi:hypothetical protein
MSNPAANIADESQLRGGGNSVIVLEGRSTSLPIS